MYKLVTKGVDKFVNVEVPATAYTNVEILPKVRGIRYKLKRVTIINIDTSGGTYSFGVDNLSTSIASAGNTILRANVRFVLMCASVNAKDLDFNNPIYVDNLRVRAEGADFNALVVLQYSEMRISPVKQRG